MLSGWFDHTQSAPGKFSLVLRDAECGKCGLFKDCINPFMSVRGKGKGKILVVGESPGMDEDRKNKPFVGKTGRRLQDELDSVGIDLFHDCWVINAARCRPKDNLLPSESVKYCRPNVIKDIDRLKPEIIILVGWHAVRSVIGHYWKEDIGDNLNRWLNWHIPCQVLNAWICPIWHPSFIERNSESRDAKVIDLLWHRQLESISQLSGRPWNKVPNYASKVEIVLDSHEAAAILDSFQEGRISYDTETDSLKPDSQWSSIVYCSVCWKGKRTIAFCWQGKAIQAFRDLVRRKGIWASSWNDKHDLRWIRKKEDIDIRNHDVDGMLESHVLCNKPGTKSLKFQSWVRLGQDSYDHEIKSYLKAKGNNTKNRIREFDRVKALRYCGLDALLDYKLKRIMAKEINNVSTRNASR